MNKQLKTNIITITIITTIVITIFTIGYTIGKKQATEEIWENNRRTETVVVKGDDTLWDIAQEYKPKEIYILEYIEEIKKLNNIDSDIHGGDTILVYVY